VTGVVALAISSDANNSAGTTQVNILAQYAKDYPDAAHQSHGPCNPPPNNAYFATCQKYVNLRDRRDTFQTVAIISFIGAGAAGVAIPIVYFTTAKRVYRADQAPKAHRASVDVVPLASPSFQGLALTGRF
jgi:hypothetical protein